MNTNSLHKPCAVCATRRIVLHALYSDDWLRTVDGQPVAYQDHHDDVVIDFGIVSLTSHRGKNPSITVTQFGEPVMRLTTGRTELIQPGGWMAILVAIEANLTAKFGMIKDQPSCIH